MHPATDLGPAGIPDANGPGLRALVDGGGRRGRRPRHRASTISTTSSRRLARGLAAGADAIIVSGGVSVGPYDVVKAAFETDRPDRPVAGRGPAGQAVRIRDRARGRAAARRSCSSGCPGTRSRRLSPSSCSSGRRSGRLAGRRDLLRPVDRRGPRRARLAKSAWPARVPARHRRPRRPTGRPSATRGRVAVRFVARRAGEPRHLGPRRRGRAGGHPRGGTTRCRPAPRSQLWWLDRVGHDASRRAVAPCPATRRMDPTGAPPAATARERRRLPTSTGPDGRAWSTSPPSPSRPAAPSRKRGRVVARDHEPRHRRRRRQGRRPRRRGTRGRHGWQAHERAHPAVPSAARLPTSWSRSPRTAPAGVLRIRAEAATTGQTGVEMEAMTAASVAALTVYDMVKGVERGVETRACPSRLEDRREERRPGSRPGDMGSGAGARRHGRRPRPGPGPATARRRRRVAGRSRKKA